MQLKPVSLPKKSSPPEPASGRLCDTCQSSKFMRWSVSYMDEDRPPSIYKDTQRGDYFLIRCDYFRLNVFSPESLSVCDAWKARGEKCED